MGMNSITQNSSLVPNNKCVDNSLIGEQNYTSYLNLLMNKKDILLKNKRKKRIVEEKKESVEKVPTTFEWSNDDNCVYLTGSFCNWNQFFLMKKTEEGKSKLTLNLPKGTHQYKFIINDEWKYNNNFPICNDNGNINNIIDTSNLKINLNFKNKFQVKRNLSIGNKNNSKNTNFAIAFNKYTDYIPLKGEFKKKTPRSPYQYKRKLSFNNNNNNKLSKQIKKDNIRAKFFPEEVNHLHCKENITDTKSKITKCSIINRYRLKFTKYIYYRSEYK